MSQVVSEETVEGTDEGKVAEAGTELVKQGIGTPAYLDYSKEKIALLRATLLPKEAGDPDLYYLLELSARYGLDPLAREIWIAKMKGQTGSPGGIAVFVGRDGMLALAERRPGYRGFRNESVCENDDFARLVEPVAQPDGTYTYVRHSYGHPKDRGEIVGAYAEVYVDGRPPTYFFAYLSEYMPTSEGKLQYSPWKQQRSVMIEKCALATALRHAVRMSGIYLEPEMAAALDRGVSAELPASPDVLDYGDESVIALRLQQLFDALDYLPARRRLALAGLNEDSRRDLIEDLEAEAGRAGIKLPDWPEVVDAEEVVEESGAEPDGRSEGVGTASELAPEHGEPGDEQEPLPGA